MTTAPEATRPRAARSASCAADASRARAGYVGPEERARLVRTLGALLWRERARRGWPQALLARRADVSERHVRALEAGQVRPSDDMCGKLARALCDGRPAVEAAVLDLRLRRAAGPSLRPWKRRRPPRQRTQRLYAEAARVLAEQDQAEAEVTQAWLAELFTASDAEHQREQQIATGRRPRIRRRDVQP